MHSSVDGVAAGEQGEVPSADEVRAALARVLESDEFRTARNRARFLQYVVTRTLDNAGEALKEYTIGLEVFERGATFDPRTDGVVRTQAGLIRKHPAPGEESEYAARTDGVVHVDYAIVSVAPGKLPGRRVVVLSGGHTWGTQGAPEYVTEPAYLRELYERLLACQRRSGRSRHPEFFQVLLRVETRDGQPLGATFVTHRDLALDDTGLIVNSAAPKR
jgi:hypothetical protein